MASGLPEENARQKLVDLAREGWISRLIDLSRRNNLLFYRPIQSSTVDVSAENPVLHDLLEGESVPAQDLLQDRTDRPKRILEIARKALENLEEKGLATLYLACGMASWPTSDEGRDAKAPVVLLPIEFKRKGQELSTVEVHLRGDPQINPVLLHVLESQFDIHVEPADLLAAGDSMSQESILTSSDSDDKRKSSFSASLSRAYDHLRLVASKLPGFSVEESFVISNFAFQKMAMVKDLEDLGSQLSANDIVAAIAGDIPARAGLGASQVNIDPKLLDSIPPEAEFAVIEADSSQQCAIAGIAAGQSAVVHGPPGTGKSQTITNLIATIIGSGKTVLFVAEKRAALEVVLSRLEKVDLGHLAIDLHGAEQTPKKVMERIARTLNAVRTAPAPKSDELHRQFQDRRTRLNEHCRRMHEPQHPSGMSLFALQGQILKLPNEVNSHVRWRGPELAPLTALASEKITDLLRESEGFASLFVRKDPSPWTGCQFSDGGLAQYSLDAARRLGYEELPAIEVHCQRINRALGLREPSSLTDLSVLIALLKLTEELLSIYDLKATLSEASSLSTILSAGRSNLLKALFLRLFQPKFRMAYKRAIQLRRNHVIPVSQLTAELDKAVVLAEQWNAWSNCGSAPSRYEGQEALQQHYSRALQALHELEAVLGSKEWERLPLEELMSRTRALADDGVTPYRILRLTEIETGLRTAGVQKLVDELRITQPHSSLWVQFYLHAWLQSCIDEAASRDPQVRGFVGRTHDGYVDDFKLRDADRLLVASQRVRRLHAERTIAVMNAHPEQEALIKQEAAKTRRHKPLRHMFKVAGDVLKAVTPCFMASPLAVSQLIHAGANFDYVIFDEASQVLPEDAIPSILRGKHLIVAGDNKQLPPTGFFSAGNDEDDEDEVGEAEGYESLLDMMIPFAKGFHLNWHYRSRSESLISFSNHHIYDDRLITFPGPSVKPSVTHELVNFIPVGDGQEESASAEVQRVVQLVLQHARKTPGLTLGVITMGIKHAYRIQGVLDKELSSHPELARFFDTERPERFFIKNLERVQGDERDSIIMSIGYGKDRAGNLPLRFGPILSGAGRRRLNVAVTRARSTMIVVSSFSATDIDATKVRPESGLDFLRNYLQYAASGGTVYAKGELTNEPMDDFEADVYEALTTKGIKLVPQVGCSKFRIDLAACHPTESGKFVLAIECDGATYHSSYTARDRDRIRQQQLENLGWTFHRIWSTDWFMHKDEAVRGAVAAYEKAVAKSDIKPDYSQLPEVEMGKKQDDPSSIQNGIFAKRSSPRAPIPNRPSISEYTQSEMKNLYDWVCSDGILRTHDELADEMFAALPFSRRGARIETALRQAIRRFS